MSSKEHVNLSGSTTPSGGPGSPNNKIKFLCSHGGKILPSPVDGNLKYIGGESRLISVPRDISFRELMKKLTYHIDEEMVVKYQLVLDDLDSLVTVKSDDDLKHMLDEYDRYESTGAPRLRVYLFPAKSIVVDGGSIEPRGNEQRYLDAINGIVRAPTVNTKRHPTLNISIGSYGMYSGSACSSPRSPESSCNIDAANQDTSVHKVQSSPSICSHDGPHQGSPKTRSWFHHYIQNSQHSRIPLYRSKPTIDHSQRISGPERLLSVRSVGRSDTIKYQVDPVTQYYYPASRHSRGS